MNLTNPRSVQTAKNFFTGLCNLLMTIYLVIVFFLNWTRYLNPLQADSYWIGGNLAIAAVYLLLSVIIIKTFNGYRIGHARKGSLAIGLVISLFLIDLIFAVISMLIIGQRSAVGLIIGDLFACFLIQAVVCVLFSWLMTDLYRKIFPPHRILEVYGFHKNNLKRKMNLRRDKYKITESIPYTTPILEIDKKMRSYDAVLINDIPSEKKDQILKVCFDQGKRVYFTPKISDIIVRSSSELDLFDTPIYYCRNLQMSPVELAIKRFFDILLSLIGIILTSPIMLVVAILIHRYDGGPVLYSQNRCTTNGKIFRIYKFRSMIVNAENPKGGARLATEHDPRITPIGRFIRATRIDEIPQFFNVLKGDMSIVGPRPERPEIVVQYEKEIPEFSFRMHVKAGLTGYAQVYGKYNTTNLDKLKLDLIYTMKASLLLDLKLILQTIKVIFQKESTEGLQEGQTTASASNASKETDNSNKDK
jgi:exopolysaccharide biosynthesis polyprenyl glycosylphosphotransferase